MAEIKGKTRVLAGYVINDKNIIEDGTKPVAKRRYLGSRRTDDVCVNEVGRFINVELFSPVILDDEERCPQYNPKWEVYSGRGKERKLVRIDYPMAYMAWWYKHRKRCLEGYTVGGVFITGNFYFYLNFWRIKSKEKGEGWISPRYLDLDKEFFDLIAKAKAENKNIMFLKRRQIGFSEKVASLVGYDYTFFPGAHCVIVAGEAQYSIGTMGKVTAGLDALSPSDGNAGREFYKRRVKDVPEMIESGYSAAGVQTGYRTIVEAITVKDNPAAVNGRSPTTAIMEEVGINPFLKATYGQLEPAMKERGLLDGRIIVFIGTGGLMEKGVQQYKEMFYNPEKFNLLAVDNEWDEGGSGKCCPFFPAWKYHIQDNDGNSYKDLSLIDIAEERRLVENDRDALFDKKSQFPLTPAEAFSTGGNLLFNTRKLQMQYEHLKAIKAEEREQWGRFEWIADKYGNKAGVQWVPAGSDRFEKDKDDDLKYPVCILEHPILVKEFKRELRGEQTVYNLYGGGTDSYDKDKAASSDSLGASSIFKGYLDANSTSNLHVASILWRPSVKEKFFEQTAMMMIYYHNARNLIEWSNITIFDWYKNNNLEFLLKERPLISTANVKHSVVNNRYGIDPATKHIWEDHFADYIETNYENLQSVAGVERYMLYRRSKTGEKKYNCDLTIADMLSRECMLDIVNNKLTTKLSDTKPIDHNYGYVKRNGKIYKY